MLVTSEQLYSFQSRNEFSALGLFCWDMETLSCQCRCLSNEGVSFHCSCRRRGECRTSPIPPVVTATTASSSCASTTASISLGGPTSRSATSCGSCNPRCSRFCIVIGRRCGWCCFSTRHYSDHLKFFVMLFVFFNGGHSVFKKCFSPTHSCESNDTTVRCCFFLLVQKTCFVSSDKSFCHWTGSSA